MKKIDVGRIQRHMARSTPDYIVRDFPRDVDRAEIDEWIQHWLKRMHQKYGSPINMRIDLFQEDLIDYNLVRFGGRIRWLEIRYFNG